MIHEIFIWIRDVFFYDEEGNEADPAMIENAKDDTLETVTRLADGLPWWNRVSSLYDGHWMTDEALENAEKYNLPKEK